MGKKKQKRSKDEVRALIRKSLGYVKAGVGVMGFGHGIISAAMTSKADGTWNLLPGRTIYNYTGFQPENGNFNSQQAFASIGTIAATVFIIKLISWGQKHI